MSNKNLINSIKACLYLTLLVPLIVDNNSVFPFIFSKVIYFRILLDITILLFLWYQWKNKSRKMSLAWPEILLLAFFLWSSLTTIWGVDWQYSWWSGYERMGGLVSLAHYVAYFFILIRVFSEKDWRYFFRGIILLGLVIFLQSANQLSDSMRRAYGSLGNPIYLGEYFLYLFWFALLLFYISQNKLERYLMLGAMAMGIAGIFMSGSRGPFISLAVALVIFLFWQILSVRTWKVKTFFITVLAVIVLLVSLGIFAPQNKLVRNIPMIDNLSELKSMGGSLTNRLIVSGIAWQSFLERPFGWGWDNFTTAFNKHYNPNLLKRGWGDTYFDSAHNLYLDILVGTGFVGLLLWLAFFTFLLLSLWKIYKNNPADKKNLLVLIFLLAILTQFVVAFLHPSGYLLLFIILAYAVSVIKKEQPDKNIYWTCKKVSFSSLIIVLAILALFSIYRNYQAFRGNHGQVRAQQALYYQKYDEYLNIIDANWQAWGPYERDILRDMISTLSSTDLSQVSANSQAAYINLLKKSIDLLATDIEKYNKQSTQDYLSLLKGQTLLWSTGQKNDSQINETYTKLLAINDKHQQVAFTYFNYLAISEQWDRALVVLDKTISDAPDIYYPYWYKAKIYLFLKDYSKSYENYLLAKARGFEPQGLSDQNLVKLLEQLKASSTVAN